MIDARFTALASVAAVLVSCAPAPKPAPRRAGPTAAEEGDDSMPSCGGVIDDAPTPEQRRRGLVDLLQGNAIACGVRAAAEGRYGEVRATLRIGDEGPPTEGEGDFLLTVDVERGAGLSDENRRCVEQAGRAAVKTVGPEGLAKPLTVYVALGKARPALPDPPQLIADWQAAKQSPQARKRFAQQLPAEIVLGDDGCLSMPERPSFVAGIDRWLATLDQPLDELWQPFPPLWGSVKDALFDRLGPRVSLGQRAYLVDDGTVLLYHRGVGSSQRQALCLLPMDQPLREELQARVDWRATCWVGDLREIMLHPRTGVPAGRRFKAVAAEATRVCAIDERGETVCCGERFLKAPAPTSYSTISGNSARSCRIGKDGSVSCDHPWPVPAPVPQLPDDPVVRVWSMY